MSLSDRRAERMFNFAMTELVRHSKMTWDEMKDFDMVHFLSAQLWTATAQ